MATVDLTQNAAQGRWPRAASPHLTNRQRDILVSYLFVSPWIIGFVFFLAGPMIASLYLSFTKYTVAPSLSGWAWTTTSACSPDSLFRQLPAGNR